MDKPIPEAVLLPCPMCGSDAALNTCRTTESEFIRLNGRDTGYGVNCVTCGLNNRGFAYGYATPAEAITAWNRRALTAAQQQGQAVMSSEDRRAMGWPAGDTSPPSAPVGVDALRDAVHAVRECADGTFLMTRDRCRRLTKVGDLLEALAQQPAAGVTHADHVRGLADMLAPEKQADTLRAAADAMRDQQPAAVDGAMVERAAEAYLQEAKRQGFQPSEEWARSQQAKDWMRAALTAALAAQPGGSDNE